LKGRTQYQIVELEGRRCLRAESQAGASILVSPVRFDPGTFPWLSWDWRVDRLPEHEALRRKNGSDAAARVYVDFETRGLPWQKRSLDYVWSASLPVGTILGSAYGSRANIIVVESGAESLGRWRHEERDLEADFRRCFGGHSPDVVAVGVMTDTDDTGDHALAYFDALHISRQAGINKPEGSSGSAGSPY
jgi:hypothetical protein